MLPIVHTLFVRITIDGHGNALLDHQPYSAPLGGLFLQIGVDGSGYILVYLVIFTVRCGRRDLTANCPAPAARRSGRSRFRGSPHPSIQLAAVRDHRFRGDCAAGRNPLPCSVRDVDPGGADAVTPLVLGWPRTLRRGAVDLLAIIILPECGATPFEGRRGIRWLRYPQLSGTNPARGKAV